MVPRTSDTVADAPLGLPVNVSTAPLRYPTDERAEPLGAHGHAKERAHHDAIDVGVERFVEFSTSEVYGSFIHKGKEDDFTPIGPIGESRWVYAASKLASEHLSYAHYREDQLPLAIVRPFNVYGPRQVGDGAIRGMTLQALKHLPMLEQYPHEAMKTNVLGTANVLGVAAEVGRRSCSTV